MKKYTKELIFLLIQLLVFYLLPLMSGILGSFATVVLIATITLFLSLALGVTSENKIKFLYPVVIAVLFIPSVFIYNNTSAFIHALWYFLVSLVGMLPGVVFGSMQKRQKRKK